MKPITSISLSLAAVVALLGATLPAVAATLHVDNRHPRAADTNPATADAPLKTVGAAAKRVQPGDTVLVAPGIYREAVTLTVSGKPGQPIVFKSAKPHEAVISGSDIVTDWKAEGSGIWSMDAPDLKKIQYGEFGNSEWIYINAFPLDRADSKSQLLPGSFWHDFDGKRVWVAPEEGLDIAKLTVEYARREGLIFAGQPLDDIHVIGFTLVHNADWFRGKGALEARGKRWLIEDNVVRWASYSGLTTGDGADCIVRNNVVEWCGDAGVGGGGNIRLLFENNQVRYNNWRRINTSFEGGGSKWAWTSDSIVRGNTFSYNHGWAIWFDIANMANLYENNVAHDNSVCGLFSEISWDDVIRDNVSFNNGYGIVVGESPGTVVQRNLVFNNGIGIRMRGDFRRQNEYGKADMDAVAKRIRAMPGIEPIRAEQWIAGYLKHWVAPRYHALNNAVVWDNVVFGNTTNYFEQRDYAEPSPVDPFINNYSDRNLFYTDRPETGFRHGKGGYADFTAWQKASGRDSNSVFADPRASSTKLPTWAESRRDWLQMKLRPLSEIAELRTGLIDSPMSQIAIGRMLRSSELAPLKLSDPRIKAYRLRVDDRPVVALWTTQLSDRRYVRLRTGSDSVAIENAYGGRETRSVSGGAIDLVVSWTPIYLHGVGERLEEVPTTDLKARSFNLPDQPVPVTATFVNDTKSAQTVRATFAAAGFAVPAPVSRTLKPGETATVETQLRPDGTFQRGVGLVRMDAAVGAERIGRVASFTVGEGGGKIPFAAQAPQIDGRLDEWKAMPAALLGVVTDAEQRTGGDAATWGGGKDLSGRLYAAWRPDGLYAAIEVADDKVVPAPEGQDPWNFDAIEFFVDGRAAEMQWQKDPTIGVFQIGVSPATDGAKPTVRVLAKSPLQGLVTASTRTENGYAIELKIPLTEENFPAAGWEAGRAVKISLLLDDRDDPAAAREHTFGWSFSPGGKNYADTSGWKTLILER